MGMSHREIIDRLGGHEVVATFLGCRLNRVVKWKTRGIPPAVFGPLVRFAKGKNIPLTEDELIDQSPAKRLVVRGLSDEARAA
jgi:hypothetical protein